MARAARAPLHPAVLLGLPIHPSLTRSFLSPQPTPCPDSAGRIRETRAFAGAQTLRVTQDSLSLSCSLPAWLGAGGDWALMIPTSPETPPPPPFPGSPAATRSHCLPGSFLRAAGGAGAESAPSPGAAPPSPSLRSPPSPGLAWRPCDSAAGPGRDGTRLDWRRGSRALPGAGAAWSGGGSSCCSTCCACWSVRAAGTRDGGPLLRCLRGGPSARLPRRAPF